MATAAEVIARGLRGAGVARLFGLPGGGSNLELIEAGRRAGLDFVLTHQESAAAIMAAVTGELTGRPGACLTTLGPGVACAANGIAYAALDRAPVLLFADRYPEPVLAFASHQRVDAPALLGSLVKWSALLRREAVAATLERAGRIALAEPRGPVHLDLPPDVAAAEAEARPLDWRPEPASVPAPEALEACARILGEARRPALLAGLGLRREADTPVLTAFAEALAAPVFTTYKAKGLISEDHPLACGVVTGAAIEEALLGEADCLVLVGFDPVELIPRPWPYRAPVVQVGRVSLPTAYYPVAAELVGEPAGLLEALRPSLKASAWEPAALARYRDEVRDRLAVPTEGLAPHRVVETLEALAPPEATVTVDAGAHMFCLAHLWRARRPRRFLISNGLATMGFALPAAIAAGLEHPGGPVLCFTGDGGLLMVAAELETVARFGLPLVIAVFNDQGLALIRAKQAQRGFPPHGVDYVGPDLVALARGFGLAAFAVTREGELAEAFRAALAKAPALLDIRIDPSGYRAILEAIRGVPGQG